VTILDQKGQILFRAGEPGNPGTFAAPVIVNPDPDEAARDVALVHTAGQLVVAALNAQGSAISFYAAGADGTFTRTSILPLPRDLPVRLAAGDLTGDGLDDLVVATAAPAQVLVFLQQPGGSFNPTPDSQAAVGAGPAEITLADVDGDGRLDIVVASQFSGDVSVLLNTAGNPFASVLRYHAGLGAYGIQNVNGTPAAQSGAGTTSVAAGVFGAGDGTDLVLTNSLADNLTLLQGTVGGFLNPRPLLTSEPGGRPTVVVSGRFTADGNTDLAVLNADTGDLSIFLSDGHGGFTAAVAHDANGTPLPLSAGAAPTGLTTADLKGDGKLDLLVGNSFGDVLVLLGNGDGTFAPYRNVGPSDGTVTLAVADLTGNGQQDIVYADAALDRVSIQYGGAAPTVFQNRQDGLLAPAAVRLADLNGNGIPDLIVANSGANDVLVYLGLGNGQFGPAHSFAVGTNPVGITVADVNGDGIPDVVVANEGSNDVSILFGQGQGAAWTLTPGPRLQAGTGPVSTLVEDVSGPGGTPDGTADLVVSNALSKSVTVLPGVGQGFFNDSNPETINLANAPGALVPLASDPSGGVVLQPGAGTLTLFPDFADPLDQVEIASGGIGPVAAVSFEHDGSSDLIVANGDGLVSLLLGEDGTLTRTASLPASLTNLTDVALADVESGAVSVYVTGGGQEAVARLTFNLTLGPVVGFGPFPSPPDGGGDPEGGAQRPVGPELVPLSPATLEVIATLVPRSDDRPAAVPGVELPVLGGTFLLVGFAGIFFPGVGRVGEAGLPRAEEVVELLFPAGGRLAETTLPRAEEQGAAQVVAGVVDRPGGELALTNFVIGVNQATDGLQGRAAERVRSELLDPLPPATHVMALARTLREDVAVTTRHAWQSLTQLNTETVHAGLAAVGAAWDLLGVGTLPVPDLGLQDLITGVIQALGQAGRDVLNGMGAPLRTSWRQPFSRSTLFQPRMDASCRQPMEERSHTPPGGGSLDGSAADRLAGERSLPASLWMAALLAGGVISTCASRRQSKR
jgi:FG-GAP-like repeat